MTNGGAQNDEGRSSGPDRSRGLGLPEAVLLDLLLELLGGAEEVLRLRVGGLGVGPGSAGGSGGGIEVALPRRAIASPSPSPAAAAL
ncbi:MAG TPA: hypothetical protein VMN39_07785, partial [Longimicrobiaceae bacterium]|nr:hypothetical protein [Longimicrobiaceae bacterium]